MRDTETNTDEKAYDWPRYCKRILVRENDDVSLTISKVEESL